MKKVGFPEVSIFICDGSKCGKHKDFRKALKQEIKNLDISKDIEMFKIECTDRCKFAPVMCVQPLNQWYHQCDESDLPDILKDIKKAAN